MEDYNYSTLTTRTYQLLDYLLITFLAISTIRSYDYNNCTCKLTKMSVEAFYLTFQVFFITYYQKDDFLTNALAIFSKQILMFFSFLNCIYYFKEGLG